MQDRGIDLESLLHVRSWRWLKVRIEDVANTPGTRLHTALTKGN